MHDPLSEYDLVHDEISQRRETGHDVSAQEAAFGHVDADDTVGLEALLVELAGLTRSVGWEYEEPESLAAILETLPEATRPTALSEVELEDKVRGGWLGRIAGCNLGKPIESGDVWTTGHIRQYLELADAWPLVDYIPVLEPMPAGFEFTPCWVGTTRGNIVGSDRDDDIDYAILGLHLLERHGEHLRTRDVADGWLELLPYGQVYTAERAVYKNLLNGSPPEAAAQVRNPYREWIGALIRGDIFGWVNPDDPRRALTLAYQDAALSHVANGVYGELWSAALIAGAFTSANAREAVEKSLDHIPPRSRLAEAVRFVVGLREEGRSWEEAITAIQSRYGHYSWVHTINNAAVIVAGLLWGEDDFAATVGLTVSGGWDTDSNGATAGSVSGVVNGARHLPDQLVAPLEDRTRSALFGFDNSTISDLAARTTRLASHGVGTTP